MSFQPNSSNPPSPASRNDAARLQTAGDASRSGQNSTSPIETPQTQGEPTTSRADRGFVPHQDTGHDASPTDQVTMLSRLCCCNKTDCIEQNRQITTSQLVNSSGQPTSQQVPSLPAFDNQSHPTASHATAQNSTTVINGVMADGGPPTGNTNTHRLGHRLQASDSTMDSISKTIFTTYDHPTNQMAGVHFPDSPADSSPLVAPVPQTDEHHDILRGLGARDAYQRNSLFGPSGSSGEGSSNGSNTGGESRR
jgi:hypothetical protein